MSKYSDMIRMYNILEKETDDLGSIIHFDEKNLDTFGIRVYNLLFMSCNLFELAAKEIVKSTSEITESSMNVWKINPIICQYSKTELTFIPMGLKFKPMETLGYANIETRVLGWWKEYNLVKHNLSHIHKATLRNLIYALGSAGLLVSQIARPEYMYRVERSILFDSLYMPCIR
ncbi:MAG: hypothetical protein FIA99_13130 [Ruminiclostridium sp.]|nr:hypothetical protein [Ruminiclostridium sp.]